MFFKSYPWQNWRVVAIVLGEGCHAVFCAILLGIGAILALPGSSFATSPAWAVAAKAASEEVWSARYLMAGAISATAFFTAYKPWRMGMLWIAASANLGTALILLFAQPLNTGTVVYSIIALGGYGMFCLQVWDATQ